MGCLEDVSDLDRGWIFLPQHFKFVKLNGRMLSTAQLWSCVCLFVGQLFGHIHKDDIRLQMYNDTDKVTSDKVSFLLTAPGITPLYRNNPGFRLVTLDKSKRLLADYEQYFMDLVLSTRKYIEVAITVVSECSVLGNGNKLHYHMEWNKCNKPFSLPDAFAPSLSRDPSFLLSVQFSWHCITKWLSTPTV